MNYGPIEHAMYYSKIALEPNLYISSTIKNMLMLWHMKLISCVLAYTPTSVLFCNCLCKYEAQQQIRKGTTFIWVFIVYLGYTIWNKVQFIYRKRFCSTMKMWYHAATKIEIILPCVWKQYILHTM